MGIHWKAPSLAVGALLSGALLALGHHLFYASLDGAEVSTIHDFTIGGWSGVPAQRFNIAVGTLFAFLVKTCLCFAVGTAQIQVLWRHLKAHTTRILAVDSMTSLTDDVFAFLDSTVWRYPMLVLLAIIIWLTPIAAIITPSTLSVDMSPHVTSEMHNVSNVDFTSLNFANIPNSNGLSSTFSYAGPQFAVSKVVIGTAAQGQILPIPAPSSAPNATYRQIFTGPALQCDDVSGAAVKEIANNIMEASTDNLCSASYGYLAWTPDAAGITPFVYQGNGTLRPRAGTLGPMPTYPPNPSTLSIYIATLPGLTNKLSVNCWAPKADIMRNATILQCQLFNATYHVDSAYKDGMQEIQVSQRELHGGIAAQAELAGLAPLANYAQNGSLIPPSPDDPGSYNASIIRTYAYQSVMDAFGHLLTGSIASRGSSNGALVTRMTSIMNTVLGDADELAFLRAFESDQSPSDVNTLQIAASLSNLT